MQGEEACADAFRSAEKRYQLRKGLTYKKRGNKRRGHEYIAQATDLSNVIDVHRGKCGPSGPADELLDSPSRTPDGTPIKRFRHCPHCVYFPGALNGSTQLALARLAMCDFPNAPARTNHTAAHGLLSGIWQAARAGRILESSDRPSSCTQQQPCAGAVITEGSRDRDPPLTQQAHGAESDIPAGEHKVALIGRDGTGGAAPQGSEPGVSGRAPCRCAAEGAREAESESRWVPADKSHLDRKGRPRPGVLTAERLWKKLRWATLGPPYNWTERSYERNAPGRPLPQTLRALACAFAALAYSEALGSPGAAAPATHAHHVCTLTDTGRLYTPDAAIVNYYHEGDTLNGHKDDVELDLLQPIVTVSLGCDAVFLLGGEDRETEPRALMLHSGDVLVMLESARRCYHGIPRVLPMRALPQDLRAVSEGAGKEDRAILQELEACRINISIRHTAA